MFTLELLSFPSSTWLVKIITTEKKKKKETQAKKLIKLQEDKSSIKRHSDLNNNESSTF